ncbi:MULTISPECIES: hypothetical protein [Glaesserella]|nr:MULTISPECIES: hypothetical protein [Glaesserella]
MTITENQDLRQEMANCIELLKKRLNTYEKAILKALVCFGIMAES